MHNYQREASVLPSGDLRPNVASGVWGHGHYVWNH